MAERTDINREDDLTIGGAGYAGRSSNTGSTNASGERSPEEIEREIEHTRAEMAETIDAIEERLSPRHIKEQVKESIDDTIDSVRDRVNPSHLMHSAGRTATYARRGLLDAVRENPLPAVVTGIGLVWLIRNAAREGRSGNDFRTPYANPYAATYDRDYYGEGFRSGPSYRNEDRMGYGAAGAYGTDYGYAGAGYDTYGAGGMYGSESESEGPSMTDRARSAASRVGERASEMGDHISETAGDLADQTRNQARYAARQARYGARRAGSWIEENPIITGAAVLGVGALIARALTRDRDYDYAPYYGSDLDYMENDVYAGTYGSYRGTDFDRYAGEDMAGYRTTEYYSGMERESGERSGMDRARSAASDMSGRLSDTAGNLADRARHTASSLGSRMSSTAGTVADRASSAGRTVQYRARRAGNWLDSMMHESPLACGAVALGVGALVGLALPGTRKEDEWMGDTRDHLMDDARGMARQYVDRGKNVAERVMDRTADDARRAFSEIKQTVKDVAVSAKETAREEARNEGLVGGSSNSGSSGGSTGSSGMTGSGTTMGGATGISGTTGGTSSGSTGSSGSGSTGSTGGTGSTGNTGTTGGSYSSSTTGRTGATTTNIGGSTTGASGLEGTQSGVGPQADRKKTGSNL